MAVRLTVYGTANMKQIESARKELDRLEKSAIANSSGFSASMTRFSNSATNAGQKMTAVGGAMTRSLTLPLVAVGAGLYKATQAAADDAQQQVILATALRNTTGATNDQIASVENWISTQGKNLGVMDDQLRPAINALATATGDLSKAQQLASVAMDISAAKGVPVETAANALAKAYAGNTMTLGRMLPGISKAALASGDLGKIMGEVNKIVGGQAANAADTEAGARARANVALQESIESLGVAFLPIMRDVTNLITTQVVPAIQSVTKWFSSLDQRTQGNIVKFGLFLAAAGPVVSVLGALTTGVGSVARGILSVANTTTKALGGLQNFYTGLTNANAGQSAFATRSMKVGGAIRSASLATKTFIIDLAKQGAALAAQAARWVASTAAMVANKVASFAASAATKAMALAQWALNAAMTANPIGIVVVAIGALVAALVVLFQRNETFRNAVIKAWEAVKNAAGAVWRWIQNAVSNAFNFIVNLARNWSLPGLIIKHWDSIKSGATKALGAVVSFFKGLPSRILSAVGNLGNLLLNAGRQLLQGLWNGINNAKDWILDKIRGLGSSVLDGIKGVFGISSPSKEFKTIGHQLGDGLVLGIQQSTKKVGDASKFMAQNAIRKASLAMDAETRLAGVQFNSDPFSDYGFIDGLKPKVEKVKDTIKKGNDELKELVKRTAEIMKSWNVGEMVKQDVLKVEDVLAGMKSQAVAMQNWVANIASLKEAGLAKGLVNALLAGGPSQNASAVNALAGMTKEQLAEYNAAYRDEKKYAEIAAKMQMNKDYTPKVSVAPGAVQVTINGNADGQTVQQAVESALNNLVLELRSA